MKIYIGTSGWQYYHWKGKFYPEDLPSKDFLKFYSKYFNTVEINTNFYHFTKKSTFEKWQKEVNKNFLFSIKLHRLFTHFRKLKLNKDDKRILKETIETYKVLGKNLGPILIQLPPSLKKDLKVLEKFLKNFETRGLTRMNADNNHTNASRIKRIKHELTNTNDKTRMNHELDELNTNKFENNSYNNKFVNNSRDIIRDELVELKLAIEFRHKSWLDKETYNFLKKKKVAFVISDSPRWSTDIVKTTDFVYIRFHGKPKLFASKYEKEELQRYAKEIKKLKPKTLFAYFNNDAEGYAIEDALKFKEVL
jgi:uncharacterized protein YecE (DUF72 family)